MLKFIGNFFENGIDCAKDYGRQAKIAFGPHQRKPNAHYTKHSDGTIEHNVDLSDFPPEKRQVAEQVVNRSIESIEHAEEQLANARANGDEDLEDVWETRLGEAKANFTEVKWQLETRDIDLQTIGGFVQYGPLGFFAEGMRTGKLDQRIKDAVKLQEATGAAPASGTSGTSGTSGAEGAEDAPSEAFERVINDVSGAVERFESDPQAFFEELKQMSSPERATAMQAIQNEIQANNQLMSMLSNFHQAMHDTNKAVIANLRV